MGLFDGWIAYRLVNRKVNRLEARLRRLEYKMATFEEVVTDLYNVTENIADRIEESERVNAQLREAVENNDQARAAALAGQAAEHASVLATAVDKLRGLGQVQDNPVPDTAPVEPAPDAPAEVPNADTGALPGDPSGEPSQNG